MKSIRCFSKFPLTEAVMVKWRLITHNENTPHDRTENPAAVFIHRTGRNSWLLPSLFVAQGGQIHLAAFSCRYLPGDIRLAFVLLRPAGYTLPMAGFISSLPSSGYGWLTASALPFGIYSVHL